MKPSQTPTVPPSMGEFPREIRLASLDKTRPVVVLTRDAARAVMTKVTAAPITSTVKGLSSEVPLGPANGLDDVCAIAVDNTVTIPSQLLGRVIGHLSAADEEALARAVALAFDLDLPLLTDRGGDRDGRPTTPPATRGT